MKSGPEEDVIKKRRPNLEPYDGGCSKKVDPNPPAFIKLSFLSLYIFLIPTFKKLVLDRKEEGWSGGASPNSLSKRVKIIKADF